MMRFLTGTAMAVVLAATPVIAQTPPAPPPAENEAAPPAEATPPAETTPPAGAEAPSMSEPAPAPGAATEGESMTGTDSAAAPAAGGDAQFVTSQQPGDWNASKLVGETVTNSANESVGEISDLVLDSTGKVVAAVIGVGGFLGIGARNVAVRYESLQVNRDDPKDLKVTLNVTKETLGSAPEYKTAEDAAETAGGGAPAAK